MFQAYEKDSIYIAGPECFYTNGNELLAYMRKKAEATGFGVTLPNDTPLDLSHEDLRKNADAIFENLKVCMNNSTAIIADLELYRGSEPDGGSVYEIGMAYARGIRCYGYTRDKRPMIFKHQNISFQSNTLTDENSRVLPYQDLPFCPCLIGSSKIVEGDFDDCLNVLMLDVDEDRKAKAKRQTPTIDHSADITIAKHSRPVAYLAGPERYDADCVQKYQQMKEICANYGIEAIAPIDQAPGVSTIESNDPYTIAYCTFDNWQQHVRNCDLIIANLNDFHGMEPSSDVSFECGMAFQLGKKMYGYLDKLVFTKDKIPHYEANANGKYKDIYDNDVENFNYPINLMFGCSMKFFEGDFEKIIQGIAKDLEK